MLSSPFLLKSVWKLQHGHSGTGFQLSVPDFYGKSSPSRPPRDVNVPKFPPVEA